MEGEFESWELAVRKHFQGKNNTEALVNAGKLNYDWNQEASTLLLDPYFSLDKPNKWRAPGTRVTIFVPEGKYIHLDKNTRYFLDRVETADDVWKHDLAGEVEPVLGHDLARQRQSPGIPSSYCEPRIELPDAGALHRTWQPRSRHSSRGPTGARFRDVSSLQRN